MEKEFFFQLFGVVTSLPGRHLDNVRSSGVVTDIRCGQVLGGEFSSDIRLGFTINVSMSVEYFLAEDSVKDLSCK